jgi:phosphoribosyl-AMP cyclohydrolase
MAAGLGFKDFTTGEVLTAADVDGYLMQGVWVFASAAARDAAVTSPQEGNFAYLKDTNVTTYYTGSAWANLDTTGMTNPMTTTGDTIYSSSGSTPARLGIGTAGQVLTVNSGATAPEWATPSAGGGGKVLQVVQATTATQVIVASTTMTDSGLSASITPSSATSKILVIATQGQEVSRSAEDSGSQYRIMRDATQIWTTGTSSYNWLYLPSSGTSVINREFFQSITYLDSPSTTSAITYKTQGAAYQSTSSGRIVFQSGNTQTSTIILMEIGA